MFEDFLQADVIPFQTQELEDSAEMLFVHSIDDLIEKTLGDHEIMIICKKSIIGFTDKVSFHETGKKNVCGYTESGYVRVKGPGIVYIETYRNS